MAMFTVSMPAVNCHHSAFASRLVFLYPKGREACIFGVVLALSAHFAGYHGDKPPIVTHRQSE
jgi:hypothetical protein